MDTQGKSPDPFSGGLNGGVYEIRCLLVQVPTMLFTVSYNSVQSIPRLVISLIQMFLAT